MNIGDRIKKVRKSLDLTQEAFALRIGTVQNTITGYESGRRNPSAIVISLICREFNVNEEWLRNGAGEMFLPDSSDELNALVKRYNLSKNDQTLIEKYVNLDSDSRKKIIDFMTGVVTAINNVEEPTEKAFSATLNLPKPFEEMSGEEIGKLVEKEREKEKREMARSDRSSSTG